MEAEIPVVWLVMDNAAFGTIAGLEKAHYGWSFGCLFESEGKEYRVAYADVARGVWRTRFLPSRGERTGTRAARRVCVRHSHCDSRTDGKRADANAGVLEH